METNKEVQVYQLCECDAVAAYSLEEARKWYMDLTGLDHNELYSDEEVEIVPMERKVWDEEQHHYVTVREIVETEFKGSPILVLSMEV